MTIFLFLGIVCVLKWGLLFSEWGGGVSILLVTPFLRGCPTSTDWLTAKLLLTLASTVILGFELHGTLGYILLSDGSGSLQTASVFPHIHKSKSKSCCDWRSVGQSVLVSSTYLGPKTRFFLPDSCGFVDVGRSLWREDGSIVYNCCWPSPVQSFSGPSPAGLMTIFYCLRFETPPTCRARSSYLYPPGTGWPSHTPRHWVPFP
jgi:hypothetical protein